MQTRTIKILSTKILQSEIVSEALKSGISIECISFIEIKYLDSPEVRMKLELLSRQNIRAIFTSANAVRALKHLIPEAPHWTYSMIEGQTKIAAESYFGEQKKIITGHDAESLAKALVDENDPADKYFFRGELSLDILPKQLRIEGLKVEEITVYKTDFTPQKVGKEYSGVLFFSPSAVESFFINNEINDSVILFAIGETTASKLKYHCSNEIVISDEPSQDAFLKKIKTYYKHE